MSIKDYYRDYGNLSYEVDREHTDRELTRGEMELMHPYLSGVKISVHFCCGAGRHVAAFGLLGIFSIGVDLSPYLVITGNKELRENNLFRKAHLIIGNAMESPLSSHIADCVTILGNSFSFLPEEEGQCLLAEAKRLLHPKGIVVLDIPLARYVVATLSQRQKTTYQKIQTASMGEIDAVWIRELDTNNKTIHSLETYTFWDAKTGKDANTVKFTFHLYEPEDICAMASNTGLKLASLMEYTDHSDRYLGMLRRRIFLIMKARA